MFEIKKDDIEVQRNILANSQKTKFTKTGGSTIHGVSQMVPLPVQNE